MKHLSHENVKINLENIYSQMSKNVNFEIQEIWLQRIAIKYDITIKTSERNELANMILDTLNNKEPVCLWDTKNLAPKYKKILEKEKIINEDKLYNLPNIIHAKEVRIFEIQSL